MLVGKPADCFSNLRLCSLNFFTYVLIIFVLQNNLKYQGTKSRRECEMGLGSQNGYRYKYADVSKQVASIPHIGYGALPPNQNVRGWSSPAPSLCVAHCPLARMPKDDQVRCMGWSSGWVGLTEVRSRATGWSSPPARHDDNTDRVGKWN